MTVNKRIAIMVFLLGCLLPTMGEAASFDCVKAGSPVEKTVCADPKLSNLDEELAKNYNSAIQLLSEDGKKILRDGQRQWLRFVNDVCFKYKNDRGGSICLQQMYETRIKDMKTAAVQVGPYLFSRIDYYFSKSDDEFGRPYEGHTSYPRIDNPSSDVLKKWNALMAPHSRAEGEDGCDGRPGDADIGFTINSATDTTISAQQSNWMYCHGTAHGYGGTNGVTYILTPEPHLLKASDLFSEGSHWEKFLIEQCHNAIMKKAAEMMKEATKEEIIAEVNKYNINNEVTNPSAWSLTKDGIVVTLSPPFYAFGPTEVAISWDDLRPFLLLSDTVNPLPPARKLPPVPLAQRVAE